MTTSTIFLIESIMKLYIIIAAIAATSASLDNDWKKFKSTYRKTYRPAEEQHRKRVWVKNLQMFREHNWLYEQGKTTFTVGENQFSDMTPEEFKLTKRCLHNRQHKVEEVYDTGKYKGVLPEAVDWRTKGYVTSVKDQGDCGSCYAFGTSEALEGQHFKATGNLVELSPSNIVDCSGAWGNDGCGGGLSEWTWEFLIDRGLDTLKSYPYIPFDGVCRNKTIGATMSSYKNITHGSEDDLQKAVATIGPIAVAICAGNKFFAYKGGIFDDPGCSSTYLDHEVLVVGYGSEGSKDFWIVKNSYGTKWGEDGYIRMSRNKDNQCGIATDASYPII